MYKGKGHVTLESIITTQTTTGETIHTKEVEDRPYTSIWKVHRGR